MIWIIAYIVGILVTCVVMSALNVITELEFWELQILIISLFWIAYVPMIVGTWVGALIRSSLEGNGEI